MQGCSDIRRLLYAEPGSLSDLERGRLDEHLRQCLACRQIYQDLSLVDQESSALSVPDPGDNYWDSFYLRVRTRLTEEESRSAVWYRRLIYERPAVAVPLAVAAIVVLVFIGQLAFGPGELDEPTQYTEYTPPEEAPVERVEVAPESLITEQQPAEIPGSLTDQEEQTLAETTPAERKTSPVSEPEVDSAVDVAEELAGGAEDTAAATPKTGEEVSEPVLAGKEPDTQAVDLPRRKMIIVRGDTAQTELGDAKPPRGRDLELAEQPNAPFPEDTGELLTTERVLGTNLTGEYDELDSGTPALNRGTLSDADRNFFDQRIAELTDRWEEKMSGEDRRELCRELVDLYYHVAVNWREEADVRTALEYIEEAREILREEDYPDLDAKAGALKSLLN